MNADKTDFHGKFTNNPLQTVKILVPPRPIIPCLSPELMRKISAELMITSPVASCNLESANDITRRK